MRRERAPGAQFRLCVVPDSEGQGPVSEIQEALSFVEKVNDIDAAILDVDLHGQKSYPVAQALAARQIRFVFATGYGEEAIDRAYRSYPRLQKPFDERALVNVLVSPRPT